MSDPTLHSFFNSSASYRVRIALHLKQVPFQIWPVNIRAGNHQDASYRQKNRPGLVPLLETCALTISQSIAIFDYLDYTYPEPLLVPQELAPRAKALQIASFIACEMHPLNNLRVLKYLAGPLGLGEDQKNQWTQHWLRQGFEVLESEIDEGAERCVGSRVSIADCFLIPQIANARRVNFDLSPYPKLMRIEASCLDLHAFQLASPAQQPDKIS